MKLSLIDVIQRSLANKDDVKPLVKYLGLEDGVLNYGLGGERNAAELIASTLRKLGSNDVATLFRGGDGVSYDEVVMDVGKKLKAPVAETNATEENEQLILLKMFEDALERMSDEEKRVMFRSMGMSERDIPVGAITTAILQSLLRQFGGFYIYQISVIVANMVSRAILGAGLSFATNAAITRAVGTLLGPIGWIATGLWLAIDLAGPAYRKTVPAVIHIALLRSILINKITIGVVGDGSSGKDSLVKAVFGLKSNINPIAGSTSRAVSYPLNDRGNAVLVNYPGFNDYRNDVDQYTDDQLHHTDAFVMVVDINRGISKVDIDILDKLKLFRKPILICLNKVDLPRTPADLLNLEKAAKARLSGYPIIKTSFDPDTRLQATTVGCLEVYNWVKKTVEDAGKGVENGNFPPPPSSK